MKITININRSDYWEFNKYALLNVHKMRNKFIMSNILTPVVITALLLFFKLPLIFSLCWGIFGGGFVDIIVYLRMKKRIMSYPDNKEGGLATVSWTDKLRASRIKPIDKERNYYAQRKTYIYKRIQEPDGSVI